MAIVSNTTRSVINVPYCKVLYFYLKHLEFIKSIGIGMIKMEKPVTRWNFLPVFSSK